MGLLLIWFVFFVIEPPVHNADNFSKFFIGWMFWQSEFDYFLNRNSNKNEETPLTILSNTEQNKTMDIDTCDYLLCTGLFDHESENLNYYKKILSNCSTKKMICTNPDLTVHRGKKQEYCAGSIAQIFELYLIFVDTSDI